jgi:fumarate hydratase subunit beta
MDALDIFSPICDDVIAGLRAGQKVLLSGVIYTARDAAHKKIFESMQSGGDCDFDVSGQTIYYAGPCPAKPRFPIGPVGPTTSGRMDVFTPYFLDNGLRAMIGKGIRSIEVKDSIKKNRARYFAAVGGAAVVIMNCVKSSEFVAFEELGTEAVRKLAVEKLPLIVAIDMHGGDIYE